jgi:hypothetical protein
MIRITEEMREAARKLLRTKVEEVRYKLSPANRARLAAVAEGKRKQVDSLWWSKIHGRVSPEKLDKLQRLADPTGNPMERERAVARHKLTELKKHIPPGLPPMPPEIDPEMFAEPSARRRGSRTLRPPKPISRRGLPAPDGAVSAAGLVNTTRKPKPGVNTTAQPKPAPVNTTAPGKPRSADRHLEPNRDRHRPGYMREYMRRRRAAERKGR